MEYPTSENDRNKRSRSSTLRSIPRSHSVTPPANAQRTHFEPPPDQNYTSPRPTLRPNRQNIIPNKSGDNPKHLKQLIYNKHDKVIELEYLNSFLQNSIKLKEEMIQNYHEENARLRDDLINKDKLIERLKSELRSIKTKFPDIYKNQFYLQKPQETSQLDTVNDSTVTPQNTSSSPIIRARNSILQFPNPKELLNKTDESPKIASSFKRKFFHKMVRMARNSSYSRSPSQSPDRSEGGNSPSKQEQIQELIIRRKTVTETQGRRGSQTLFLDNFDKLSILKLSNEDIENTLKKKTFQDLKNLLEQDDDEVVDWLVSANDLHRNTILETMRAVLHDMTSLSNVIISLRRLFKANSEISASLLLKDAIEKIVEEACSILSCDRVVNIFLTKLTFWKASVFIADHINRILWTKAARGSNTTIRVPIDAGVVGYAATTGEPVKIEEAYVDSRFNKEVDKKNNYRTKTILCVPIKDFAGGVIGVCQAVNKLEGTFTEDDLAIFKMLSDQAGVMLKNSMKFDSTLIVQYKLDRLLKLGISLYDTRTLPALFHKIESSIKEVLLIEKGIIFLVDEDRDMIYRIDENNKEIISPCNVGIIGQAIIERHLYEVHAPNNNPYFNPKVDIDTQRPLLCLPIWSKIEEKNKLIAIVQIIDLQLIGNKLKVKTDSSIDSESLHIFIDILRACIEKIMNEPGFTLGLNPERK